MNFRVEEFIWNLWQILVTPLLEFKLMRLYSSLLLPVSLDMLLNARTTGTDKTAAYLLMGLWTVVCMAALTHGLLCHFLIHNALNH